MARLVPIPAFVEDNVVEVLEMLRNAQLHGSLVLVRLSLFPVSVGRFVSAKGVSTVVG